jgi:conjugative transfer pilus assembly protein TraH
MKCETKTNLRLKTLTFLSTLLLLQLLLPLLNANAGGLDSFLKFAEQRGSMTSINKGGVIEDQLSGYHTGGSIISRGPRPMELQPLGIQLPSASLDGCTGSYDLRWGGFSYIRGPQLAKYFKAVGASAGTYVTKMAIKTACPQCEDIMSSLEAIARDVNGMTFSQCEQGKAIAEGLMSKFNSASNQKCMAKAAISRGGSDLFETTQKCQDNPSRYGEIGDNNELKSMLPDNYNLVWKALSHGDGRAPTGMKELMMSISGSIIGRKQEGTSTIKSLPSLIEKEDLIEQYIGKPGTGTSMLKLYSCDEVTKCLNPVTRDQTMSNESTLYGKVETTLKNIIDKISNNRGSLSDEEQALIEYSTIPIISLFEIELALKDEKSVVSLAGDAEFIEVVCYDMVTSFMRKMLLEAKTSVEELQTAQLDNTPIERFQKNVESVQAKLKDKKIDAMSKLQTIIAVKERLTAQERVFQLGFSRFADN